MVAMTVVGMMQVAVDKVVDVVAMRNCLVSATRAVDMIGGMRAAGVIGRTGFRIGGADFDHVLVEMTVVRGMQVAVVQVVHMVAMADRGVAAARAVDMVVIFMNGMSHYSSPSGSDASDGAPLSLAWAKALNIRSTMCWSAKA